MFVCVRARALFISHAKGMRHVILSSVVSPAVPYFSTLRKETNFEKKKLLDGKCVD